MADAPSIFDVDPSVVRAQLQIHSSTFLGFRYSQPNGTMVAGRLQAEGYVLGPYQQTFIDAYDRNLAEYKEKLQKYGSRTGSDGEPTNSMTKVFEGALEAAKRQKSADDAIDKDARGNGSNRQPTTTPAAAPPAPAAAAPPAPAAATDNAWRTYRGGVSLQYLKKIGGEDKLHKLYDKAQQNLDVLLKGSGITPTDTQRVMAATLGATRASLIAAIDKAYQSGHVSADSIKMDSLKDPAKLKELYEKSPEFRQVAKRAGLMTNGKDRHVDFDKIAAIFKRANDKHLNRVSVESAADKKRRERNSADIYGIAGQSATPLLRRQQQTPAS